MLSGFSLLDTEMRYAVSLLNVTGDEEEGWKIKDRYHLGGVDVNEDALNSDTAIFNILNEAGYFDGYWPGDHYIEGDAICLTIHFIEDDKPLMSLDMLTS